MKYRGLLGVLWLGLLLGAAGFCIMWGRTPTKGGQVFFGAEPTMRVIRVEVAKTAQPIRATAIPTPSPTPVPTATPDPAPFSLFWYSDTQYYAYKRPEIFRAMATWSIEHAETYNALAVVHTGDIVDNHNYERHWQNATSALTILDGHLPLYCIAGNHDVGADTVDYTMYRKADYCDVREPAQLWENGTCWVQPIADKRVLLVGIGWQKGTPYLDWVKARLDDHPDDAAILLVHNFLDDNGVLTDNGKLIEEGLIRDAKNVRLVLCGHRDGSARWQQTYDDGQRTVHALMYNFQDDKKKGLGYLRILTFDPVLRSLSVTTYSPYLDDFNYYSDASRDTFTIPNAF